MTAAALAAPSRASTLRAASSRTLQQRCRTSSLDSHILKAWGITLQAHLESGSGAAGAYAGRDTDSGSEAESSAAVSDLSAYADGSTITGTESASGVPASTIGGRKPVRRGRQKVLLPTLCSWLAPPLSTLLSDHVSRRGSNTKHATPRCNTTRSFGHG